MGRGKQREIPAARRGHIVQRVLVDGWSPARAAQAFAIEERRVAAWVADYRRRGMASLRDDEGMPERGYRSMLGRLQGALGRYFGAAEPPRPGGARPGAPAACIELRRTGRDGLRLS